MIRGRLPDITQKNKDKLPGVGEYNIESLNNKIIPVKFTRESRSHSPPKKNEQNPGPGTYFPVLLQQKADTPVFK